MHAFMTCAVTCAHPADLAVQGASTWTIQYSQLAFGLDLWAQLGLKLLLLITKYAVLRPIKVENRHRDVAHIGVTEALHTARAGVIRIFSMLVMTCFLICHL